MTYQQLVEGYKALNASSAYIFGFEYYGVIYAAIVPAGEVASNLMTYEKAYGNRPARIKFLPTIKQKFELLQGRCFIVESTERFNARPIKNKGDRFEAAISEYFGIEWTGHNSTPCWQGGDIVLNGIDIQLKYERATYTTESTLKRRG